MDDNLDCPVVTPYRNDKLKCEKCSAIPDITIFNSKNRVKIFLQCENRHLNISLLDEYIKNNILYSNNIIQCQNCKKEKNIKICQFCNNYLCEECNNSHLTIDHILNNKISEEIYNNNYLASIEKEENFKVVKGKILNSIKYLKEIIEYYKRLEDNFKKFMIDNLNEIMLIKILINNYIENNQKEEKEKLIKNLDFLLAFNNLIFKSDNLNEFLLNSNNYILFGDRYKGEKKNGEYEGKGEMEYFNGKYEGEWKNGLREGFGIYKYNNGDKYMGIWRNNLEEGDGRFIYKNGDIYDGYFKEGKKEGKGLLKFSNILEKNINQFYGEWKNDKKNGEGIIYFENGDKIEAIWENNIMNNKRVKYNYINGEEYIGEYMNNKRNGKGIMKYKNKEIYNGDWKDDKKEGEGIYI